jgi:uncharacterized protein YndB with AHSA1/START domain
MEQTMEIHHAMIIRNVLPDKAYEALTQAHHLERWMDAPTHGQAEVGATFEFYFDQGQRVLKMEITHLEVGKLVQWRVLEPMWPIDQIEQTITWTLTPYESSTLVDFRMAGWPFDNEIFASVSYKWALFMTRLKLYLGDTRELITLLPVTERT